MVGGLGALLQAQGGGSVFISILATGLVGVLFARLRDRRSARRELLLVGQNSRAHQFVIERAGPSNAGGSKQLKDLVYPKTPAFAGVLGSKIGCG